MIISLLLLQLVYTARGQISVAREVEQRVRADLLIHSAKNEALFLSIVTPGSFSAEELSLISAKGARTSEADWGFEVRTRIRDISGLLPLRFPNHPLWPSALRSLGMDPSDVDPFLNELKHMQDLDNDNFEFSEEPFFSSAGHTYPNMPIQLPSSLRTWVNVDAEIVGGLEAISHHYMQVSVNFFATPSVVSEGILGEYGVEVREQLNASESNLELRRYLETKFSDWVGVSNSGLWRLEMSVQGEDVSRQERFDFRVSMSDGMPFTVVGN
jgi:hypothetical protein